MAHRNIQGKAGEIGTPNPMPKHQENHGMIILPNVGGQGKINLDALV